MMLAFMGLFIVVENAGFGLEITEWALKNFSNWKSQTFRSHLVHKHFQI